MKLWGFAVLCAALLVAPRGLAADLEAALVELEAALETDDSLSPTLRRALGGVVTALRDDRRARTARAGGFWDRVDASADLRLRHEHDGRRGAENRNRERARFRFGLTAQLDERLQAGVRARTGSRTDPQSPYHNFGTLGDSLEINLDRLYLRYEPRSLEDSWLAVGKIAHPFATNPVYGELVWDADVSPEGIAFGYGFETGSGLRLEVKLGEYLHVAQNDGDEVSALVAQGVARASAGSQLDLMAALGWYRYTDTAPDALVISPGEADNGPGNAVAARGFAADFRILNPIVALTYRGLGRPLTFAAEYVRNTGADGPADDDDGFALGLAFGEAREPRGWRAYYQYQRIGREAVFAAFAQDDFMQNHDFRGHVLGLDYRLGERLGVRAWGLVSRRESTLAGVPDDDGARLRLDLDARF